MNARDCKSVKARILNSTPSTFAGSTPELVRDGVRYVRLGRRVGNHGSSHHITFALALPQDLSQGLLAAYLAPYDHYPVWHFRWLVPIVM